MPETSGPTMLCEVDVIAVLVTLGPQAPLVFLRRHNTLPSGPLDAKRDSLQRGFQQWAEKLTDCVSINAMEQLYTFADQTEEGTARRLISISYLAISRDLSSRQSFLGSFYDYFPWEDRRTGDTNSGLDLLIDRLLTWAHPYPEKLARVRHYFGLHESEWDDEKALDRYELLWEAGLVGESAPEKPSPFSGLAMAHDHRRILATALSRLRSKVRYSAMIFEFLPMLFTLNQLQHAMETITGRPVHKSNFRRLVLNQKLLEETGRFDDSAPGRPARFYRFCQKRDMSCYLSGANLPLEKK
ncbi:hypothetical protein PT277_07725 [Acetobacteraceae bacterium ESL0709]|nr:hypothetical protein [Acetobacteraceae bacterium ESL0697]MDF7678567.1 hypothetical protein [Acetobacteraceae bacterium ESL0709]